MAVSRPLPAGLSRAALAARGVVHLLAGWLAAGLATSRGGLEAVSRTAAGAALVWLVVAGFAGLALWRLTEAVLVPAARPAAAGRVLLYATGCALPAALAAGRSRELVRDVPAGRWLLFATGLAVAAAGAGLLVNAVRLEFMTRLATEQMGEATRAAVRTLGAAARPARALAAAACGLFLCYAALAHDPARCPGVDGTLGRFTRTPAGPWALVLIAAGLLAFGVFSLCEARYRRLRPERP